MENPVQKHRQAVLRQIIAPVAIPIVLLLIMAIALFGLSLSGDVSGQQITVIASIMAILFILLPSAILMLIPVALVIVMVFGTQRVYEYITVPMRHLREYTAEGTLLVNRAARQISEPTITLRVKSEMWSETAQKFLNVPDVKGKKLGH